MTLLIAFALVSVAFSFLCSILEAALLSITPSYIRSLKSTKPVLYSRLNALKDNIDDPLSAILTLNTVAHTAGATGVGAQVAVIFGEAYLGLASAVMTLLILFLSEIIPKTIGAVYWRNLAPFLPAVLKSMILVFKPIIWVSQLITRRIGNANHQTDIRAEIGALTDIGLERRELDEETHKIVLNTLSLSKVKAKDIMTPRTVSKVAHPEQTVSELKRAVKTLPFSRFPIIGDDGICAGYIHRADLSEADANTKVQQLAHEVLTVNDNNNIQYILGEMLHGRQHISVVYDQLGTWIGIVTLEDILETILGKEIMDESDNVSDLRKFAKQRWSKRIKEQENVAR